LLELLHHKQLREHLDALEPIQAEVRKYVNAEPLGDSVPEPLDGKGMAEAFAGMHDWEAELQRLYAEQARARPAGNG